MERMGDDSMTDITSRLDAITHLHVAEYPRRSAPLADGNVRHSQVVPAVIKAGYKGYWGLEYVPGPEPLQELKEAVALFQKLNE
jgi:hydroxypyruvate isomerase